MKKDTLTRIYNTLKDITFINKDEILAEIEKEMNRGAERKEATAKEYEVAKDVIIGALGDAAATVAEIYEAIKGDLPEGFGKGKVQYALTHLWQDQIAVVDGTPKSYRRKWG